LNSNPAGILFFGGVAATLTNEFRPAANSAAEYRSPPHRR